MKTVDFSRYGSPDTLRVVDTDIPVPGENEVLMRIHASSINSWDWELLHAIPFANRLMFGMFRPKRLKTLGIDVAGRVEAVGGAVRRFRVGDAVYGDLSACGFGGFAEYVAAPEQALYPKPANISFAQAAAVPQAGLLAWQGLVDAGGICAGQKILINGASGGSGSLAVQIARNYDVEITGTCRREKMDFVRTLGVDHVIDYTRENYTRRGERYDLIIDAQARHPLLACRRALRPGGVYVAHGGASGIIARLMLLGPLLSLFGNRRLRILFHKANKGLDVMSELLATGRLVPNIDRCFELDSIVEAMSYYGQGRTRGKIVIRTGPED